VHGTLHPPSAPGHTPRACACRWLLAAVCSWARHRHEPARVCTACKTGIVGQDNKPSAEGHGGCVRGACDKPCAAAPMNVSAMYQPAATAYWRGQIAGICCLPPWPAAAVTWPCWCSCWWAPVSRAQLPFNPLVVLEAIAAGYSSMSCDRDSLQAIFLITVHVH
jgi:hypothetical protein